MRKTLFARLFCIFLTVLLLGIDLNAMAAPNHPKVKTKPQDVVLKLKKITVDDRSDAANKLQSMLLQAGLATLSAPQAFGEVIDPVTGYLVPDYFGSPNWAYSPRSIRKFIDKLAGLGPDQANLLGQYIPLAIPDTESYPNDSATGAKASDYYEIAVVEYMEKMHSDLEPTRNRGYVQIDTKTNPGDGIPLFQADGTTPIFYPDSQIQVQVVDNPHYMGPAIVSRKDRPVRIKFYNLLPTGEKGDLFLPVDHSLMGPAGDDYTENRANIHLHGNNTVWISDGSPHQWITPAAEKTPYPQGTSVYGVPDMDDANDPQDGSTTLYYTNTQSARLMFYHDQSFGITRLNVYAGQAAPYIIRDDVENDLIFGTNNTGINPMGFQLPGPEIPLVIQDRTFVDATTIGSDDPTWAWGESPAKPATATTPYIAGKARTGDLWFPHVYSPTQNPYDITGANPFGRWIYGPWFYPPAENIEYPAVPNPYYTPNQSSTELGYRPPLMPGTPNPSAPGDSFMDTPLVNGTVYPYLDVQPKAYRFRILNAATDRFFNLSLYVADDDPLLYPIGSPGYKKEMKLIPATPGTLPPHIPQILPDPSYKGPNWIQIGNEGGFLPTPVEIEPQPTTWNLVDTAFNGGNVVGHSLLLGTSERADVIVDFSQYAGKTLILYNDAPSPFPSSDPRYDYFTGNLDQKPVGGSPQTKPGFGPNTRTIMQIRVGTDGVASPYDMQPLLNVFATRGTKKGAFAKSQDTIIVPKAPYNDAYGVSNLPALASGADLPLDETSKTFMPIDNDGHFLKEATLPLEPKVMLDEISGVFDSYGRKSNVLESITSVASSTAAPFKADEYSSPPVEILRGVDDDLDLVPIGDPKRDGTQIWQITHTGVDTHIVHTHLFSGQLIHRVASDGALLPPDLNELGWKETFRINPLEQTLIAMRPKVPKTSELPWPVPNSVRLILPTMPAGAILPRPLAQTWLDPQGNVITPAINHEVNFGWEYVYPLQPLSSEGMDQLYTMVVNVKPQKPKRIAYTVYGKNKTKTIHLSWVNASSNETAYLIQRALSPYGPWINLAILAANSTTYSHLIGNTNIAYYYKVIALNTIGDAQTPGSPTLTSRSADSGVITTGPIQTNPPADPLTISGDIQPGPQILVNWTDHSEIESGFLVERKINDGSFTLLTILPANKGTGGVRFLDTTVLAGNGYTYQVAAINSAGPSRNLTSDFFALSDLPNPPSAANATASRSKKGKAVVTLSWTNPSLDETGFTLERSTNPSFTGQNLVSVLIKADTTTYKTGKLSRNTAYYFRIRTNNSAGSSTWTKVKPFPVTTP